MKEQVFGAAMTRYLAHDTLQTRLDMSKLLTIVNGLKSSVDGLVKKQESLNQLLQDKENKNTTLQISNNELQKKVSELQAKLDAQAWQHFRNKPSPKTLVVGSSLAKYLDKEKMVNTDIKCNHNVKLQDITSTLKKIPVESGYNRIVIIAGNNDIAHHDPNEVTDSYRHVIAAAKDITTSVTISSICDKPGDNEKLQRLNAGLQVLAGESDCSFMATMKPLHYAMVR